MFPLAMLNFLYTIRLFVSDLRSNCKKMKGMITLKNSYSWCFYKMINEFSCNLNSS